jgi:hypothetical protein
MDKAFKTGRDIDQMFIDAGFCTVATEISIVRQAFGETSYDRFIFNQSTDEAFIEARLYQNQLSDRLVAIEKADPHALPAQWGIVLEDERLDFQRKRQVLNRFFPERYLDYLSEYSACMHRARAQEMENICVDKDQVTVSLLTVDAINLRKATYNKVMGEEMAKLGFARRSTRRGIDLYSRDIQGKGRAQFVADRICMERVPIIWPTADPFITTGVTFDRCIEISGAIELPVEPGIAPKLSSVAQSKLWKYSNTKDFEVLLRANALWLAITTPDIFGCST